MKPTQNQITHQYNNINALPKLIPVEDSDISDFTRENGIFYAFKPPNQWSQSEVLDFLQSWSQFTNVDLMDVNMREFIVMDGKTISNLSWHEFNRIDPRYGLSIHKYLRNRWQVCPPDFQNNVSPGSDIPRNIFFSSHDSNREDRERTNSSTCMTNEIFANTAVFNPENLDNKEAGRRGRPLKTEDRSSRSRQAGKDNKRLWECIRDLLLDPATNPSLIRWVRYEDGIFKFVQPEQVAKMWGDLKRNPHMRYEKLSRALRNYYNTGYLSPVPKTEGLPKRLIYKFGPNATGWHRERA